MGNIGRFWDAVSSKFRDQSSSYPLPVRNYDRCLVVGGARYPVTASAYTALFGLPPASVGVEWCVIQPVDGDIWLQEYLPGGTSGRKITQGTIVPVCSLTNMPQTAFVAFESPGATWVRTSDTVFTNNADIAAQAPAGTWLEIVTAAGTAVAKVLTAVYAAGVTTFTMDRPCVHTSAPTAVRAGAVVASPTFLGSVGIKSTSGTVNVDVTYYKNVVGASQ